MDYWAALRSSSFICSSLSLVLFWQRKKTSSICNKKNYSGLMFTIAYMLIILALKENESDFLSGDPEESGTLGVPTD